MSKTDPGEMVFVGGPPCAEAHGAMPFAEGGEEVPSGIHMSVDGLIKKTLKTFLAETKGAMVPDNPSVDSKE